MPPLFRIPQVAETGISNLDTNHMDNMDEQTYCMPHPSAHGRSVGYYCESGHLGFQCATEGGQSVSIPLNYASSSAPAIIAPKPMRSGPSPLSAMAAARNPAARTYHTAAQLDVSAAFDPSTTVQGHAPGPFTQSVELFSVDAAPPLHLSSLMAAAHPSASPYQPQLDYPRDYTHDGVFVYSEDAEIYENPTASQLAHPVFLPYALHCPYAMDPIASQGYYTLRPY
ncbi:hypothetical protein BDY19DRAFT_157428 [Irpex rosettiformis]|uniref:Uncharacterized protein n=1 Tax=Irpex rosettiformis TaxID=378272 RepID=A0ACB8U4P2_9APHY|nr:hypothetical protein BDY19DRAFT_157428 [Irpex rosettiformis]